MEDLRSKSYNGNNMQIEPYNHQSSSNFQDFRCHSASYTSSSQTQVENTNNPTVVEFKKVNGRSISKIWSLNDPEMQRKKRVASYKAYSVEGKVKVSIKKSFRWIKDRYTKMVYGFRS